MKDEPDIVKELKEIEKLGLFQGQATSDIEELKTVKESSEDVPDETVGFAGDTVERGALGHTTHYEMNAADIWNGTFNAISDLIFIQDKEFTIIKGNKAFTEALKSNPEDIVGKKCYELLHKSDRPWPNCPFETTKKHKKICTREVYDPNIGIPLLVTTSPIFDDKGSLVGSVHIAKDISEQKKAEEEKEKFAFDLNERLKEFKCLYNVTNSIRSEKSLEELLVDTTKYIREAWQYPEVIRSKIIFDGKKYKSDKFEETEFKQTTDIIVGGKTRGVVEVYYIKKMLESDEGPFLKEERKLLDEIASYLGMYVEKIEVNKEKNKLLRDMSERIKELNCLYEVSKLIENPDNSLYDIFQKTVELIPPSWQYPEITCARIIFEGKEFKTPNFKETKWKQSSDIRISGKKEGIIEVYYLEEKPESAEGPFLKEERHLIDGLAKQLGSAIKRTSANEELKKKVDELEQHKKFTIGRELKMVKLKNKIRELEGEKLT